MIVFRVIFIGLISFLPIASAEQDPPISQLIQEMLWAYERSDLEQIITTQSQIQEIVFGGDLNQYVSSLSQIEKDYQTIRQTSQNNLPTQIRDNQREIAFYELALAIRRAYQSKYSQDLEAIALHQLDHAKTYGRVGLLLGATALGYSILRGQVSNTPRFFRYLRMMYPAAGAYIGVQLGLKSTPLDQSIPPDPALILKLLDPELEATEQARFETEAHLKDEWMTLTAQSIALGVSESLALKAIPIIENYLTLSTELVAVKFLARGTFILGVAWLTADLTAHASQWWITEHEKNRLAWSIQDIQMQILRASEKKDVALVSTYSRSLVLALINYVTYIEQPLMDELEPLVSEYSQATFEQSPDQLTRSTHKTLTRIRDILETFELTVDPAYLALKTLHTQMLPTNSNENEKSFWEKKYLTASQRGYRLYSSRYSQESPFEYFITQEDALLEDLRWDTLADGTSRHPARTLLNSYAFLKWIEQKISTPTQALRLSQTDQIWELIMLNQTRLSMMDFY